ncbi:IS1404 Transposase [Mycoavidus cysteinexigens]|uniref:IS1404 Transposase n=1 Tax=Mycoavidus cysteinexigens TaxID=1553431 RepID=A0A2Z6EUC7_9BURK|nr:IS1404 Transposase [Mycoavidus cysteinexigens]
MVSPQARREAVALLKAEWQLSERRACGLVKLSTSVLHYESKGDSDGQVRERISVLANERRRFGYRRIHILLKREGWAINVKRVYRLYRQAGLAVRKRHRKRIGLTERVPLQLREQPNHAWSMDFVHDALDNGRRIRCLNVVDDFTKESLAIEVDTSISGLRVTRVLDRIAQHRALPKMIRVDHGPEFTSQMLDAWAHKRGVNLVFTQPGNQPRTPISRALTGAFEMSVSMFIGS